MEMPSDADNRQRLRAMMEAYDLTSEEVAELVGVSVHTINSYRSRNHVPVPDRHLELLEYKLADQK